MTLEDEVVETGRILIYNLTSSSPTKLSLAFFFFFDLLCFGNKVQLHIHIHAQTGLSWLLTKNCLEN